MWSVRKQEREGVVEEEKGTVWGSGAGQTYLWPNIQQQIVRPAVAVNEMSFSVLTRLANVAYTQHAVPPKWPFKVFFNVACVCFCCCLFVCCL